MHADKKIERKCAALKSSDPLLFGVRAARTRVTSLAIVLDHGPACSDLCCHFVANTGRMYSHKTHNPTLPPESRLSFLSYCFLLSRSVQQPHLGLHMTDTTVSSPSCSMPPKTSGMKPSGRHNALGTVGYVALCVPVVALAVAQQTQADYDIAYICLLGASGFSLAALLLWLRANYLAANYLEERQLRRENYIKSIAKPQTGDRPPGGEGSDVRRRGDPRTIARLDPVFPAFLCVCAVIGAGACIIAATLQVVWDVRVVMTKDRTGTE